jgi:hypothetical protein
MNNEPKTSAHMSSLQRGGLGQPREGKKSPSPASQSKQIQCSMGYGVGIRACTPRGLLEILRLYFLSVSVSVAPPA